MTSDTFNSIVTERSIAGGGRRRIRRATLVGMSSGLHLSGGSSFPVEAARRATAATFESIHGSLSVRFILSSIFPVFTFDAAEVERASKGCAQGIGRESGSEDGQRPEVEETSLGSDGGHFAEDAIRNKFVVDSDHDLDDELEDAGSETNHFQLLNGISTAAFLGPVATLKLLLFRFRLSSKIK